MTHGYIQEFMLLMLVHIKGPFGGSHNGFSIGSGVSCNLLFSLSVSAQQGLALWSALAAVVVWQ